MNTQTITDQYTTNYTDKQPYNHHQDVYIPKYTIQPPHTYATQLDHAILSWYQHNQLTTVQRQQRRNCISRISELIHSMFGSHVIIDVFGSYASDVQLHSSDIDIVIQNIYSSHNSVTRNSTTDESYMLQLQYELIYHNPPIASNIRYICDTPIPVIKYNDNDTYIGVDISIQHNGGTNGIKLIESAKNKYIYYKVLLLFMKSYLYNKQLSDSYLGGCRSYLCSILLIIHLQLHQQYNTSNDQRLSTLLIHYFEFYSTFDFNRFGIKIDNEFNVTIINRADTTADDMIPTYPYITDPYDNTVNVGKSCYRWYKLIGSFKHTLKLIRDDINIYKYKQTHTDIIQHILIRNTRHQHYKRKYKYNHYNNQYDSDNDISTHTSYTTNSHKRHHNNDSTEYTDSDTLSYTATYTQSPT